MGVPRERSWPQASEHVSSLSVSHWPGVAWPPWGCPEAEGAFLGPDDAEFRRILERKAELAREYPLGSTPLWLLIVCEDLGDLQSHIQPKDEFDVAQLVKAIQKTGFNFESGPFGEVWLLSAFSGAKYRIYPSC